MPIERCEQCGFDSEQWTTSQAMAALGELPARWRESVTALTVDQLGTRPIPEMWSIAEYANHVRETLFGMRFLLDTARAEPGTNLGEPPDPGFDPEPRTVDIKAALAGIDHEANTLRDQLSALPDGEWSSTVRIDGRQVDAHWIARHAVHDATHHLLDVDRLRRAL